MRVVHMTRRPVAGYFSVEGTFASMRQAWAGGAPIEVVECPRESRGVWARLVNVWHAARRQGDVNHILGDVHFLALGMDGGRTVLTVLDCGPAFAANPVKRFLFRLVWMTLPCRRVKRICAISERTRQEVIEITGVGEEKVRVVPVCIADAYQARRRAFRKECPRILHVGSTPNKNVVRLIRAVAGLRCELHLVGRLSEEALAALRETGVAYRNEFQLSDAEILRAYEECDLLAFVSTYEGFGMPIAEANAVGRAVVTSNLEPMTGVAGGSAILVDPLDIASIRAGIERCIEDDRGREELIERGLWNAERFRPAAMAAAYQRVYEEVYAEAGAR